MIKDRIINFFKWFYHSYIWIGILVLIVDIISKNIVCNNMVEGQDPVHLIPGFLSITYTINRQAAFGLGPSDPTASKILYICVAAVAIIGISIYFAKNQKKMPGYVKAALFMIVAGALGNMIDRIIYSPEYLHALPNQPGGVVDFIDFFNGSALHKYWHFIFNIADCGVVIGCFILLGYCIVDMIKEAKQNKEKEKVTVEDNEKVLSTSEKQKLEEQEKNRVN